MNRCCDEAAEAFQDQFSHQRFHCFHLGTARSMASSRRFSSLSFGYSPAYPSLLWCTSDQKALPAFVAVQWLPAAAARVHRRAALGGCVWLGGPPGEGRRAGTVTGRVLYPISGGPTLLAPWP